MIFARLRRLWLLGMFLAPMGGCAGTETGNPPATYDPTVEVIPSDAAGAPAADGGSSGEILTRADELSIAYLSIAQIDFLPEGSCGIVAGSPAASVDGEITTRDFDSTAFVVPEGRHCALRLWPVLAPEDDPTLPEPIRGHSLAVQVWDTDGDLLVDLRSRNTQPILLWANQGVIEAGAEGLEVRLALDAVAALFEQMFYEEPVEPDGTYVFDEADDASFLRAFEATPGLHRLLSGLEPPAEAGSADGDASAPGAESEELAASGPTP